MQNSSKLVHCHKTESCASLEIIVIYSDREGFGRTAPRQRCSFLNVCSKKYSPLEMISVTEEAAEHVRGFFCEESAISELGILEGLFIL